MIETLNDVVVRTDATTLALIFGVVTSVVVSALTKFNASSKVKAIVNLLLSGVGGVLATFTVDGFLEADLATLAGAVMSTWIASIVSYYGFWKPTGVSGTVAEKTANIGVGGSRAA